MSYVDDFNPERKTTNFGSFEAIPIWAGLSSDGGPRLVVAEMVGGADDGSLALVGLDAPPAFASVIPTFAWCDLAEAIVANRQRTAVVP